MTELAVQLSKYQPHSTSRTVSRDTPPNHGIECILLSQGIIESPLAFYS